MKNSAMKNEMSGRGLAPSAASAYQSFVFIKRFWQANSRMGAYPKGT